MKLTLDDSLPIIQRDDWDGDAARDRIFAWAEYDTAESDEQRAAALDKAERLFLLRREESETKADCIAPCGDIVDGEPALITSGMRAALAAVNGARGGIEAPQDILDKARDLLQSLLDRAEAKSAEVIFASPQLTIKKYNDGRIIAQGYAVIWDSTDLDGEKFTRDTDLGEALLDMKSYPLLYEHGLHPEIGAAIIGRVVKAIKDDIGLLIEAELERHAKYIELVKALAERGALGLSTGAVAHLVRRENKTITVWPIVEVSLTPTPAEPKTLGVALVNEITGKSGAQTPMAECDEAVDAAHDAARDADAHNQSTNQEVKGMLTVTNQTKSFGSFVKGAWSKALSTTTGSSGGYLVPQEFIDDLYGTMQSQSFALERAFVVRVNGEVAQPALDYSKGGNGKQSYFGGFAVSFFGQNTAVPASEPAFTQYVLRGLQMGAQTPIANALLRATRTDQMLSQLAASAIADAIDQYAVLGTGAGEPLGVLNAPATISIGRQTAGQINAQDIARMYSRHVQFGRNTSLWLVSPQAFERIVLLTLGNYPVFQPSFAEGASGTIMGIPVIKWNRLPAVGTRGDVMLVDWAAYALQIGDDVEIAMSEHARFEYDQTVLRVILRVDGQPRINAPIADPTNNSPAQPTSPFVVLQ